MTLLAIDPGRGAKATIGWCTFKDDGTEIGRGELDWAELARLYRLAFGGRLYFGLERITTVVIEDFVNDPRVRRGGQHNGASEVIGAVEILAYQAHVPFIRQDRSELPAAKMHAQYTDTHKHLPHKDAAYLHGFHWFVGQGITPAMGIGDTLK
jgi:hypothetical protein